MSIVLGGKVHVPSRFFFAPINTGLATDGAPTHSLIEFHRARAGKRIGIAYVGNVAVHSEHATNSGTLHATSSSALWPELVAAIHGEGSIAAAQLASRLAPRMASRTWVRRNEHFAVDEIVTFLKSVPTLELDQVANLFRRAARALAAHDFRVLQIHAAHGYLLSQLLTPTLNRRTDEYGRDPTLLLRRCVAEVRAAVPHVVVDIRVSLELGSSLGTLPASILEELVPSADLISVSAGHYEFSRELTYPARRNGENVYLHRAAALAESHPSIAWNCAGNIRALENLALGSNMTVSIGRPLLADPEFVEKSLSGRRDEIVACDWNGACHYYTRGKSSIECPLSPDMAGRKN